MDIVGDRKFVEVPGGKTHELPPLLVSADRKMKRLDRVMRMAADMVDSEDIIGDAVVTMPDLDLSRRKMDLAINMVDQYLTLVTHWKWGDSILEWIRQCETTFETRLELQNLLKTNVWPHAGRSSFVQLLADKEVDMRGVPLERAVGLRLAFQQPPPMSILSDHFLFYLGPGMASTAYNDWSHLTAPPVSSLPPERFSFEVINMSLQ
jgi:hypothetical protein